MRKFDRLAVRFVLIVAIPLVVLASIGVREILRQQGQAAAAKEAVDAVDELQQLSELRLHLGHEATVAAALSRSGDLPFDTAVSTEQVFAAAQMQVDRAADDLARLDPSPAGGGVLLEGLPSVRADVLAGTADRAATDAHYDELAEAIDGRLDRLTAGPLGQITGRYQAVVEAQDALADAAAIEIAGPPGAFDLTTYRTAVAQLSALLPTLHDELATEAAVLSSRAEGRTDGQTMQVLAAAAAMLVLIVGGLRAIVRPAETLAHASIAIASGHGRADALPTRGSLEVLATAGSIQAVSDALLAVRNHAVSLTEGAVEEPPMAPPLPGPAGDALQHALRQLTTTTSQLRLQAATDDLTGLPNRRVMLARIDDGLDLDQHRDGELALLHVDVDRFEHVKDVHGPEVGDAILVELAGRLRVACGPTAAVGGLGGDQFLVLVDGDGACGAEALALTIAERVRAEVSRPIAIDDGSIQISARIGISTGRRGTATAEQMLREASAAARAAKNHDSRTRLFEDIRRQHTAQMDQYRSIARAVDHDELRLYLQPIIDSSTARVVSAEALVRWYRDGAIVPAAEFITAAEESGQVERIDDWTFAGACRTLTNWEASGDRDLTLSVNVSATSLRREDFAGRIAAVLDRHSVDPTRLCLELTETLLVDDIDAAILQLDRIRSMGLKVALDDFGTGYSSLTYLRRLPADYVKIDRSFVRQLPDDDADQRIIEMIVGAAQKLNLEVVAEGVETVAQKAVLDDVGCNLMQGYLFGRPMPLDVFESWRRRVDGGLLWAHEERIVTIA